MIISIDHGNKAIKTPHTAFTSGVVISEDKPGFRTDYITWNGHCYTLLFLTSASSTPLPDPSAPQRPVLHGRLFGSTISVLPSWVTPNMFVC